MAIRCVSGEVFEVWLDSDIDEWSVKTMSHSCQLPLYPGEGQPVCVYVGKGGKRGLSLHVFLFAWVCAQLCLCTAECVLFWQPSSTHVNGMAKTLHKSAVWNQAVSEMAKGTGVKLSDLRATLRGTPLFYWENPWSVSSSNPFPLHLYFNSLQNTLQRPSETNCHLHTAFTKLRAWVNKMHPCHSYCINVMSLCFAFYSLNQRKSLLLVPAEAGFW